MRSVLVLLALLGGLTARAAEPVPEPSPFARLYFTGGGAARQLNQDEGNGVIIRGLAPTSLHLSGAWFFKSWLGVQLEGRAEFFQAVSDSTGERVPLSGFALAPMATFRWQAHRVVSLEGQAGWSVAGRPIVSLADGQVTGTRAVHTGPILGAVLNVDPASMFAAQVFTRVELAPIANVLGRGAGGFGFSLGAQARIGALRFGKLTLGVAVSYELAAAGLSGSAGNMTQLGHRFGVGVALEGREAPAPVPVVERGRIAGRVTRTGGAPVAGASVAVGGKKVVTGADGRFDAGEIAPGEHEVRVSAKGLKPAQRTVQVAKGGRADVSVTLEAPSGPGRVTGVVRAGETGKPLPGARVSAEGGAAVTTAADGAFVLERAGPGPVKVTATLAGYADGEEVVQVPPEAEAKLDFTLAVKGVKAKATVRGLVRGPGGVAVKATVRVQELKLKIAVKADGRFVTEIPGGHYTLVIEAPGYVTQTKVLDVADGDQAIFHADLEKAR